METRTPRDTRPAAPEVILLSFAEAIRRVLDGVEPLGVERAALRAAADRVLGEDVIAREPLPRFDHSAMDGYAVHSAELGGAGPWRLPVRGESRAGAAPAALERGCACRVFTGAALPAGADAVILQEDARAEDGFISVSEAPEPGQHLRRRGEDLQPGELALARGTRLGAHHLGLAASLDRVELLVARRPRVSIVSTGDELRAAGTPGGPTSIPESNGLSVAVAAARVGALTEQLPISADDAVTTRESFERALGSTDLLVTIGGVSVGDYDLVRPALEAAGATLDFWKVAIKPGKPLVYGRAGKTRVLGLPGNPVSAQLTFALFGLPLLRALQGEREREPRFQTARLLAELHQRPGRMGFYRGRSTPEGVLPLDNQASGNVVSLARADVLIIVPAESTGQAAGTTVEILKLADL